MSSPIKMRILNAAGGYSSPVESPFVSVERAQDGAPLPLPRAGEQFITVDDRAFSIQTVEYRFDLVEVHLFCQEHQRGWTPREEGLVD